jgi:hypothetical protein
MAEIVKEEWWLMESSFPNLNWARLQVFASGASEVFDMDGARHHFESELDAKYWLLEDEFRLLSSLDAEDEEEGEIDLSKIYPPQANTDEELVKMMYVSVKAP